VWPGAPALIARHLTGKSDMETARNILSRLLKLERRWDRVSRMDTLAEELTDRARSAKEKADELRDAAGRKSRKIGTLLSREFGLLPWDELTASEGTGAMVLSADGVTYVATVHRAPDDSGFTVSMRRAVVAAEEPERHVAPQPQPPAELLDLIYRAHENMVQVETLDAELARLEGEKREREAEFRALVDRLGPLVEQVASRRELEFYGDGALLVDFDGQPHVIEVGRAPQREGYSYRERPLNVVGRSTGGSAA
jgi:hypothetical protein